MANNSLDRFLEACGLNGPLQLKVTLAEEPAVHWCFSQPFVVVGRSPIADLQLEHPQVSRRHAYLQVIEGGIFCVDLGSRTGISWEERLGRSGWLDDGEVIRLGPARICRESRSSLEDAQALAEVSPLAPSTASEDHLPSVTLQFPGHEAERGSCPFQRVLMLVGRAPGCQLRLPGSEVSRYHCSLLRTPAGVWVLDLLGRGGIAVNGTPVRCARFDDGDELQVGRHLIRLHYDASLRRRGMLPAASGAGPASMTRYNAVTVPSLANVVADHVELTTLVARARWSPGQIELAAGLVTPLLQELGAMRAQMALMQRSMTDMQDTLSDQLQQSMMLLLQTFGSMQREQIELIREEMNQLQQLSREQHALEVVLARRSAIGSSAGQPETQASDRDPGPLLGGPDAMAGLDAVSATSEETARVGPSDAVKVAGNHRSERTREPRSATPRSGSSTATAPPSSDKLGSEEDIHAWLSQRITIIRQERQGRWQKILGSVLGQQNTPGPVP